MQSFTTLEAVAMPVAQSDVDTDQIIPARFLQKPRRDGVGPYLFHDLAENPDFVLNQPAYRTAGILVAGQNFGCGSSRENAVWALCDRGFRVVIASSFGDIFYNNCLKNGLLPVVLPAEIVARLLSSLQGQTLRVDLGQQTVTLPDGGMYGFDVDPFAKHCLLNGIDELDYTLSLMDRIAAYERDSLTQS
jgi:3-isopropylmalate/(R)-2-methylmalate dehydratase small subunit